MSKITAIRETNFELDRVNYDGFLVHLSNMETIYLGISCGVLCCEQSGYFMSNDDIESFVGAEVLGVNVVDECLRVEKLPMLDEDFEAIRGVMFVNVETDRGVLQFTAYNIHNGFYSHLAMVKYGTLKTTEDI